jgi:cation transporter-like permease
MVDLHNVNTLVPDLAYSAVLFNILSFPFMPMFLLLVAAENSRHGLNPDKLVVPLATAAPDHTVTLSLPSLAVLGTD